MRLTGMPVAKLTHKTNSRQVFVCIFVVLLLASCSLPAATPGPAQTLLPTTGEEENASEPIPVAEVTFGVQVPENSPLDEPVRLTIMEEVNGLALSARSHEMVPDDRGHYSLSLAFPVGSVVKYRYSRQTAAAPVEEYTSAGRQVRYRLLDLHTPMKVEDVVSRWTDTDFVGPSGRIAGHALDQETGQPIPGLLVTAGGAQAFTNSDGGFLLEGLPPGTHNLVGYALDGSYRTFQQGAVVAADSGTPAELRLVKARLVQVTFEMQAPEGTTPAVPIRLAGNLSQLGNTYADLAGGLSTLASRMPVLSPLPDNRFTVNLTLPAGADVHYLYTLGDGFWNAEQRPENQVRQIIVPDGGAQVKDAVESWSVGGAARIAFDVSVPSNTPPGDTVSIQFNPLFGWAEPLPMWRLGENRWVYVLNSPLEAIETLRYRVCRNDQCSAADDAATAGPFSSGYEVKTGAEPQKVDVNVSNWAWLDPQVQLAPPPAVEIVPRNPGFIAGVELQSRFHPSLTPLAGAVMDQVRQHGNGWAVLVPTWTYTRNSPPILEIVAGQDGFWSDQTRLISTARERDLDVAIFPQPNFSQPAGAWWQAGTRDFAWWLVWFEQYRNFTLHHADMAARSDAQALVIGGDWLDPALPGGRLADGSPSGVPADAEARWREIIDLVRQRYDGQIWWALPFSQVVAGTPPFLDAVDGIYVLFNEPLSSRTDPSQPELEAEAARLLDTAVLPLKMRLNKPVILAPAYASIDGGATGCAPSPQGGCLPMDALEQPNPDYPAIPLDLQEQVDIYNALLAVVNGRSWVDGFIARGYYPPAVLQEKSASVNGKPVQSILEYYFPRMTGEMP
jgi:hypothetical protein